MIDYLADPEITPVGFADIYMGLSDLSDKQCQAVMPFMQARVGGKRVKVTVVAPNGSGKDQRIIPVVAYWWLFFYPKGRVVITSKSDLQITGQTKPALESYYHRFGWPEPVQSPRFTLRNGKGDKAGEDDGTGFLIAFVTNDAGRVEGWHERPGSPLLLIVNEAKSVTQDIFTGLDRCTPTAVLQVSSPGKSEGRFYDTHSTIDGWIRIKMGLKDCPWIPQSKIDDVIANWGPDHEVTRSILHGEFMKHGEDEYFGLSTDEFDACVNSPPNYSPGFQCGFFDFADGRAENVFARRNGNKYWIADGWRETNEDAVVGRAIFLLSQSGLKPEQVWADAAAKSILDKMSKAGWPINRINFGLAMPGSLYKSWSVMAWIEGCNKIKRREVIIPDDDILRKQICSRQKLFTPDGRVALEKKIDLKERLGIQSLDRADTIFGAMAQLDNSLLVPRPTFNLAEVFGDGSARNGGRRVSVGM